MEGHSNGSGPSFLSKKTLWSSGDTSTQLEHSNWCEKNASVIILRISYIFKALDKKFSIKDGKAPKYTED